LLTGAGAPSTSASPGLPGAGPLGLAVAGLGIAGFGFVDRLGKGQGASKDANAGQ